MDALQAYRDDGPVTAAIARALRLRWLSAAVLVALGVVPLVVAIAVDEGAGAATAAAAIWFVVLAGGGGARPLRERLDWTVPLIIRATEYAFVLAIVALRDSAALPAAYAFLFAMAIHHYEIVYRIRHAAEAPPRWVSWSAGGWELRMLLVLVAAQAEVLAPVLAVTAAALTVLFVGESARFWIRSDSRAGAAV